MRILQCFFWGLIWTGLNSCADKDPSGVNNELFDLPGLVIHQQDLLKNRQVRLVKITRLGNQEEKISIEPDTSFWGKEFALFLTLDINKPAIRDRYSIKKADSVNFHLEIYKLEGEKTDGIQQLIIFRDEKNRLKKIHIRTDMNSSLFQNARILEMDFGWDQQLGEPLLKEYKILGKQKMIVGPDIEFELYSTLSYLNE